jgi:hypothetical protein
LYLLFLCDDLLVLISESIEFQLIVLTDIIPCEDKLLLVLGFDLNELGFNLLLEDFVELFNFYVLDSLVLLL